MVALWNKRAMVSVVVVSGMVMATQGEGDAWFVAPGFYPLNAAVLVWGTA